MGNDSFNKHRTFILFAIATLMAGVIMQRAYVIYIFSSLYTDHDQLLMWLGATDYKNFIFHEPCFYGQNYNVMIEAIVGAPLLFMGISHKYALPIATSLIALSPVLLMSFITLKKRWYLTAFFSVIVLLAMPLRFHMISSMPRGFITGPAIAAIATIIVLASESQWRFFWFGFLGIFSFVVLPSAALIIIPVSVLVFLNNRQEPKFYSYCFYGSAIGGSIYGLKNIFYYFNPSYNYYDRLDGALNFSFDNIMANLQKSSIYFSDVMPVYFYDFYFIIIIFMLTIVVILLFARSYDKLFVLAITFVLILFSLGVDRISDGTSSIFFSYSRYYLSIFYLTLFFIWLVEEHICKQIKNNKYFASSFISVSVVFIIMCIYSFSKDIHINVEKEISNPKGVYVDTTDNLYNDCEKLKYISDKYGADLIIGNNYIINYAYPSLYRDSPPTLLMPGGGERQERRTWRIAEELQTVRKRIILINYNYIYDESQIYPYVKVLNKFHLSNSAIYLIENTRALTTSQFIYNLGGELTLL